jgi:hypothetical protein
LGSSSPFNIIESVLTLSDFTLDEVKSLYGQHTEATGQLFEAGAIERAWYWSEGQPWLVNALAKEATGKILANDFGRTVTAGHFDEAADNLMRRQETHIDSLMARLMEPRVRRVLEPMLAAADYGLGSGERREYDNDLRYCLELGLVKRGENFRPANPIYARVITRTLNSSVQSELPPRLNGRWMTRGAIDMRGLLEGFQKYWVKTSDKWLKGLLYLEAAPHLVLTSFLQRVLNGRAVISEEYGLGLRRIDLNVEYAGKDYPIELKLKDTQKSKAASRRQLLDYMDRLLAKEGWLLVFDRQSEKDWDQKISWNTVKETRGRTIHVVGC